MLERIQRVVNNHQLSCQHTDKYFYILRGFKDFIDEIDFPVKHDSDKLNKLSNRYILEEELESFDENRFDGFKLIEVLFNFFEDNEVYIDKEFKKLKPLNLKIHDTIHIFNQIDQLTDISDQNLDNDMRLQLAKDRLHKEVNA